MIEAIVNMTIKIFRFILNRFRMSFVFFRNYYILLVYNLKFVLKRRLVYETIPSFNQKTFLTGEGNVMIGSNCVFGFKFGGFFHGGSIEFQPRYKNAMVKIGNNVYTNNNIFLCAANLIEVGDDTLIGQNVTIMDFEAHGMHPKNRKSIGEIGKVIIGKNVWIGNNVIILKNTEIGDNSIIAAGAVVSGVFPKNVIIGGVPAKKIKDLVIE